MGMKSLNLTTNVTATKLMYTTPLLHATFAVIDFQSLVNERCYRYTCIHTSVYRYSGT